MDVLEAPTSITRAEALPMENLSDVSLVRPTEFKPVNTLQERHCELAKMLDSSSLP